MVDDDIAEQMVAEIPYQDRMNEVMQRKATNEVVWEKVLKPSIDADPAAFALAFMRGELMEWFLSACEGKFLEKGPA